jgi:hypothetical protein
VHVWIIIIIIIIIIKLQHSSISFHSEIDLVRISMTPVGCCQKLPVLKSVQHYTYKFGLSVIKHLILKYTKTGNNPDLFPVQIYAKQRAIPYSIDDQRITPLTGSGYSPSVHPHRRLDPQFPSSPTAQRFVTSAKALQKHHKWTQNLFMDDARTCISRTELTRISSVVARVNG